MSLRLISYTGYVYVISSMGKSVVSFWCITFLLFRLCICVNALGLKVESLEGSLHVSSPLGIRVRINQIGQDYELGISGILLMVDLRVMDISEFDVILGMDWLTTHRVIIDYDCRRITAYTQEGNCVIFQGEKHDALP